MVRINKVYTRTGDNGTSGLADGSRLSKAAPRMTAIGDVDEANSAIGVAVATLPEGELAVALRRIQNDLFDLGADLATPGETEGALRVVPAQVERLEREIDALNDAIAPLTSFVLPGGDPAAAALHLARAIARRAERSAVAIAGSGAGSDGGSDNGPVNVQALIYLNRLSDYLFVAARAVNRNGEADVLWRPGATR